MKLRLCVPSATIVCFLLLTTTLCAQDSRPDSAQTQTKTVSGQKVKKPVKPNDRPFRLYNPSTMPKPVATYSHVAEITGGKLVYIAGQVGNDMSGNLVSTTDFRAQVEQVFKNLKAAVEAAGGDMSSMVKMNYYVVEAVDAKEMPAMREIRDKYINVENPPASTFVVVKRLARPEILVEIEAVAVVK
ncbi:MAG TPA: RidA family protein [Terriglobales bacterium]|nr:RidA family protein [Terriglobales bacterium]